MCSTYIRKEEKHMDKVNRIIIDTDEETPTINVKKEEKEKLPAPIGEKTNAKKSYLDIGLFDHIALGIGTGIVSLLVMGIGYPIAISIKEKYLADRKKYSGEALEFRGTYGDLFIYFIKWIILTILTLGIYSFWLERNMLRWKSENTHFKNSATNEKSYFTGTAGGLFVANLVRLLLLLFTLGIGTPWGNVYKERYVINNTVISGKRLVFTGSGTMLFANYIKWYLLTYFTLGIYFFWLRVNVLKWNAAHTFISDEAPALQHATTTKRGNTRELPQGAKTRRVSVKPDIGNQLLAAFNIVMYILFSVRFIIDRLQYSIPAIIDIIAFSLGVSLILADVIYLSVRHVQKKKNGTLVILPKSVRILTLTFNIIALVAAGIFIFSYFSDYSTIKNVLYLLSGSVFVAVMIFDIVIVSKYQKVREDKLYTSSFIWLYMLFNIYYTLVVFNITFGYYYVYLVMLAIAFIAFIYATVFIMRGLHKKQNIKEALILLFLNLLLLAPFVIFYIVVL